MFCHLEGVVEDTGVDAGDSLHVPLADAPTTSPVVFRCRLARATSMTAGLRLASSRTQNEHLRCQLRQHRLVARRRREQTRAIMEDVVRRRAASTTGRPARLRPPRPATDAEPLVRLHARYAATGDRVYRTELAAIYDGFAVGLARRFPSRREAPEDLAQVARLALVNALDRFEPARGRPFTAFARTTILGELKRHVRDHTWSMRIPRSLQERYLAVVRALDDLTQQLGRSPTILELADVAGLTEEQVLEAMELRWANHLLSLDAPAPDGDGCLLDPGSEENGFPAVDGRALLGTLLARLSDRERQILHLRFVEERTQADIATKIGVSQMYVSRLLSRTLSRLRARAG